eukprot:3861192-Rhodomonas_salina.2
MAMAMMLQGMILAGGQWSRLVTMMLTDEKLNLESLRARAYNHSINFGLENGANIEVNNLDTQSQASTTTTGSACDKSDKDMNTLHETIQREVIEALATDGSARGNANHNKRCWLHGTDKHTPTNCKLLKHDEEGEGSVP